MYRARFRRWERWQQKEEEYLKVSDRGKSQLRLMRKRKNARGLVASSGEGVCDHACDGDESGDAQGVNVNVPQNGDGADNDLQVSLDDC